jgi:hypothetical protein
MEKISKRKKKNKQGMEMVDLLFGDLDCKAN